MTLSVWDTLIRYNELGGPTTFHGISVAGAVVRTLAGSPDEAVRFAKPTALRVIDPAVSGTARRLEQIAVPMDAPLLNPTAQPPAPTPVWPRVQAPDWPVIAAAHGVSTSALIALARRVCVNAGVPQPFTMRAVRQITAEPLVNALFNAITRGGDDSREGAS